VSVFGSLRLFEPIDVHLLRYELQVTCAVEEDAARRTLEESIDKDQGEDVTVGNEGVAAVAASGVRAPTALIVPSICRWL
jgi:hypothetical protein